VGLSRGRRQRHLAAQKPSDTTGKRKERDLSHVDLLSQGKKAQIRGGRSSAGKKGAAKQKEIKRVRKEQGEEVKQTRNRLPLLSDEHILYIYGHGKVLEKENAENGELEYYWGLDGGVALSLSKTYGRPKANMRQYVRSNIEKMPPPEPGAVNPFAWTPYPAHIPHLANSTVI
jgi:hypothetical protein